MTARTQASPLTLLRDAAGSPKELLDKTKRLASALSMVAAPTSLDRRLLRLQSLGYIKTPPSRLQLVVGSIDMLRFWIVPASEDYYASQDINFTFHQVLRFLDEPASLVDPTGFLSTADTIIGHLMQVVHANPAYDLQLLESHDGGLEELQRQVEAMLDGTHPKVRSIGAIVEEPDYHARLLEYVISYRQARDAKAPLRVNVATGPFAEIERIFGTLPGAMTYFARLPRTPWAAAQHILRGRLLENGADGSETSAGN